MVGFSGTYVSLGNSLDPVLSVGTNGLKSVLTIFVQFIPVIIIFGVVLFIIYFLLGFFKGFRLGVSSKSKGHFNSSMKH